MITDGILMIGVVAGVAGLLIVLEKTTGWKFFKYVPAMVLMYLTIALLNTLGVFGGQRVAGLRDQGGVVEAGFAAQGGDQVMVDAAGADGGVRDVDQVVAGGFGAAERGAGGDGLADADLTGDHGDAAGGDAVADAGGVFRADNRYCVALTLPDTWSLLVVSSVMELMSTLPVEPLT